MPLCAQRKAICLTRNHNFLTLERPRNTGGEGNIKNKNPLTLDILGQTYVIIFKDLARESQEAGHCNPNIREICIDKSLKGDYRNVTIIHEVLHAIFDAMGFDEQYADEHLINCLSLGIHQVLSRNGIFNYNSPLLKEPSPPVSGPR